MLTHQVLIIKNSFKNITKIAPKFTITIIYLYKKSDIGVILCFIPLELKNYCDFLTEC